ncbi:MAG: RNA-binding S4 domain-containing protein [Erysipelotrichaceae bacterium]|nr:RNA-binding S4 domain-containing protein [Erysipelotrichaceae bacterium]
MRIDKYLKVSRILKRRPVAKELAENGRLFLNGRQAKAASEVEVGDTIRIVFGHREIVLRVLDIREQVSKQEALSLYEVIEEKKTLEV